MDKLTQHLGQCLRSQNLRLEVKKLSLDRTVHAYLGQIGWKISCITSNQMEKEILVRYPSHGVVSVIFESPPDVIEADTNGEAWVLSSVEYVGEDVDDVYVVIQHPDAVFRGEKRFLKDEFLKLWPQFDAQINEAHELCLVFREGIFKYLQEQVQVGDQAA